MTLRRRSKALQQKRQAPCKKVLMEGRCWKKKGSGREREGAENGGGGGENNKENFDDTHTDGVFHTDGSHGDVFLIDTRTTDDGIHTDGDEVLNDDDD